MYSWRLSHFSPPRKTTPAKSSSDYGIAIGANVEATAAGFFVKPVRSNTTVTGLSALYYDKDTGEITYDGPARRRLSEEGDGATIKALQDKVGVQDARIGALEEKIEALLLQR